MLATGTILVPAVNATFPILAAIACGALALAVLTAAIVVRKRTHAVNPHAKKFDFPMLPVARGGYRGFPVFHRTVRPCTRR
jgi:hypothetical protein